MEATEQRRLTIDNLRTRLGLLDNERHAMLSELASPLTPRNRRIQVLARRLEVHHLREETLLALRELGEPAEEN